MKFDIDIVIPEYELQLFLSTVFLAPIQKIQTFQQVQFINVSQLNYENGWKRFQNNQAQNIYQIVKLIKDMINSKRHWWKGGIHLGAYYSLQSTFTTLFFNLMVSEKDQNRKKKMYDNNQALRFNALLAQLFMYPYQVKYVQKTCQLENKVLNSQIKRNFIMQGLITFSIASFFVHASQMWTNYLIYKSKYRLLFKNRKKKTQINLLIFSMSQIISYPFDTITKKLIIQNERFDIVYKNAWDCLKQTYKYEGLRGFYRGFFLFQICNIYLSKLAHHNINQA